MPQPAILKITEIFPSIQGEGLRMGEPTIFVRLTGCNLHCPFCDTQYAWDGGKVFTVEQIMETVEKIKNVYAADWICLTGGEPLDQKIEGLVRSLRKQGFKVQIETNGTIFRRVRIDWITISPKPPEYFVQPAYITRAREIKIVVSQGLKLKTIQTLRKTFPSRTPILLQPQSNRKWSVTLGKKLLRQATSTGLGNIRLSIQMHKVFDIR